MSPIWLRGAVPPQMSLPALPVVPDERKVTAAVPCRDTILTNGPESRLSGHAVGANGKLSKRAAHTRSSCETPSDAYEPVYVVNVAAPNQPNRFGSISTSAPFGACGSTVNAPTRTN